MTGVRRTDPIEDRKRALMRQAAAQTNEYGIGGLKKEGGKAPRKPSMPKMPWDEEPDDGR